MGLDFTDIPDREGAALYILHTGNTLELQKFQHLADEIATSDGHQAILVDVNTPDGEKIRDFYDIMPEQLPVVMVVKDDDSIAAQWAGSEIPASDVITYQLRQIST
jgi:hypothetical protein